MLVAIYLLHQFIHQIHRFSPPPRWTTGLIHLYAGQAKGVLQQANMSAQRWLNKFKHVHWSTTGKAYVSCLLNIQDLLFCRRDAREATKRGHKTGSALVLVPLASLVLVSAVDDTNGIEGMTNSPREDTAVCQNLVPLVNIKIAGKWMFIPLKMVLIGIDPYPYMWWPIFGKWLLLIADDAKRNNMDIERRGFHRVSPITIAALLQQRSFHTAIPAYTGCKANTKVPFLAGRQWWKLVSSYIRLCHNWCTYQLLFDEMIRSSLIISHFDSCGHEYVSRTLPVK